MKLSLSVTEQSKSYTQQQFHCQFYCQFYCHSHFRDFIVSDDISTLMVFHSDSVVVTGIPLVGKKVRVAHNNNSIVNSIVSSIVIRISATSLSAMIFPL